MYLRSTSNDWPFAIFLPRGCIFVLIDWRK